MANRKINNVRNEQGSVLLESVIAIPLFMLLIGGTIWIGQLSYDKQKLVIADRYVAWNAGNRANPSFQTSDIQQDVKDRFFKESGTVTVRSPMGQSGRWGQQVSAGVDLGVDMPAWTYGFLLAGQVRDSNATTIQTNVSGLHGRDLPGVDYQGHVVLMRSGEDGSRVNTANPLGDLKIDYNSVSQEPWPEDAGKQRQ